MKLIIDIPEKDLEFIKDLQFIGGFRGSTKTIQSNVINAIKNGIPYEERSQGKWIFETLLGRGIMTCSNCLKVQFPNGCFTYCPNCGAYMKGGAE